MPLWLEELLADPALGLALVAGSAGLHRRGPVRWAHISEIPDPTPWLEGGEVLLTTGLGVKDSPELQRKLVAGLDHRGCAGIGFGVGVCLDDVPAAFREESEVRDLPLFTVPYEVPFIAVTKRVFRHIFDEHYATLRNAVDLHRQVLASVLADRGVAGVLETFSRPMPHFTCVVFDYYGQPLAVRHGTVCRTPDTAALWSRLMARPEGTDRSMFSWDGQFVVAADVRVGDHVEAVLALIGDRPLLEHEELLLEQGLTGVSLELARGLSAREVHRSRVEELLDEVADGAVSDRSVARQLERFGISLSAGFQVAVLLRPGRPVTDRTLCALVEDAVSGAGFTPVVGCHDGAACCLLPAGQDDIVARIAAAVATRGWSGVTIGRSRVKTDARALDAALREARLAAASGEQGHGMVRDIANLGVNGLLAGLYDALGAEDFVNQVVGPLLHYDRNEGTELLATLEAFLRHGCRPGPAAGDLCVHRHTLAYRLDRIRELTGRDPREGQHLLEFTLAIELHGRGRVQPPA
jgi:PucR family transcriptional regulator, purine catabolism regulatory protein